MSIEFFWVAVVATTVLSVARLSRLLVIDHWPPVKRVRVWYENKTKGTNWEWLAICPFCMAPWIALAIIGWGVLAGVYPTNPGAGFWVQSWWLFNGWLAISYLAGSYVARDGSGAEGV